MAPGIRLTRSHISTIHAALNPFHPQTSRSPLLLLSLLSTPKNTTSSANPTVKGSPSDNINVTVSILPKTASRAEITVGYVDGKVEKIPIEASATGEVVSTPNKTGGKVYPRKQRKDEEAISLDKLVEQVDGWARSLKLKDEGSA